MHYDSLSSTAIEKHYRGDVLYVQEDDIHCMLFAAHISTLSPYPQFLVFA